MNRKHFEAVSQFLDRIPPEKISNINQIDKARLFVWFIQKGIGLTYCNIREIEGCFNEGHIHMPSRLEYRLRKDSVICFQEPDSFSIERTQMRQLDERYSQYLESSLPTVAALKEKIQVDRPPLLSTDEIDDGYIRIRAYLMLYMVEVSARKWIDRTMVKIISDNWMTRRDWIKKYESSRILTPGQIQGINGVLDKAEKTKIETSSKLVEPETSLLSFLEWGDLSRLMKNIFFLLETHGFDPKLLDPITNRLVEMNDFRNMVVHSRTFTSDNMNSLETRYHEWCKLLKP